MTTEQKLEAALEALEEALEWFAEVIGRDGAPDGGEPGWVGQAEDLLGRRGG
jgi:hypothetical protein